MPTPTRPALPTYDAVTVRADHGCDYRDYAHADARNAFFQSPNLDDDLARSRADLATCDAVLRDDPAAAPAYAVRGIVRARLRHFRAAIEDFDEAIRLEPDNARLYAFRGLARAYFESGEAAISDYDRALELNPADEGASRFRQDALERRRLRNEAVAAADARVAEGPDDPTRYLDRAYLKASLGNPSYEKDAGYILLPSPHQVRSDDTTFPHFRIRHERPDFQERCALLEQATLDLGTGIRLHPEDTPDLTWRLFAALNFKATLNGITGRYDAAIRDYDLFIERHPKDRVVVRRREHPFPHLVELHAAYASRAYMKILSGKLREAAEEYDWLLRYGDQLPCLRHPSQGGFYICLATMKLMAGDDKDALFAVDKAIRLSGSDPDFDAYFFLLRAYLGASVVHRKKMDPDILEYALGVADGLRRVLDDQLPLSDIPRSWLDDKESNWRWAGTAAASTT